MREKTLRVRTLTKERKKNKNRNKNRKEKVKNENKKWIFQQGCGRSYVKVYGRESYRVGRRLK